MMLWEEEIIKKIRDNVYSKAIIQSRIGTVVNITSMLIYNRYVFEKKATISKIFYHILSDIMHDKKYRGSLSLNETIIQRNT